jgi:hypothetical protein
MMARHVGLRALTSLAFLLAGVPWSLAQSTSAQIHGTIKDESGPLPGAAIVARETQSGFTNETVSGPDGSFTLAALRPGNYEITISMPQYKPAARAVQVLVGQDLELSFRLTAELAYVENVTVVGDLLLDTRTSQIATNLTPEQVEALPQNNRNFLNFAALAPGVRVESENSVKKQFSGGALSANQTNVFIDGVSYKNDTLEGGVVGQDSSRGNPFPQNAVQEFRVLTQNFKAEYEKAASAIITAVTKSGGNTWSGDAFLLYQDKHLVANDYFAEKRGDPKPTYDRFQSGASLGGPIVKDKMQFFASWEYNLQNRDNRVFLGSNPAPARLGLSSFEGFFPSPFRSNLGFAKVSYQPRAGDLVDLTYNIRHETDVRDFGNQDSFQTANNIKNDVNSFLLRYQTTRSDWANEASLTFQRSKWNPVPTNPDLIGLDYQGALRVGGRDTTQLFQQDRWSLRDDYSRFAKWQGNHSVKVGTVLSRLNYDVSKQLNGNPIFHFRSDISFDFPFEAQYGGGNPNLNARNWELGFFAQDDWSPTPRLTINAGLRWDYESDMLNNGYVTPANVKAAVSSFVPPQYFTDGTQRPAYYGAIQPRIGFSYDLSGKGQTTLFAGYGRYFDRVLYNYTLDERYRLQYAVRTFRFSADGSIRDGQPTLVWQPQYLSKAGLDGIIATGQAPNPEVYLIDNNTTPPVSDQFTVGLRHTFGPVLASASYAGARSDHGFTFIFGNRRPNGECCFAVPGFSNILLSSDTKKAWYDALFVTLEKPFTSTSKWGMTLTYTLGRADEIGGDLFSLDYPSVQAYPRHPTQTDERNRIVATGIFELPRGFRASAFVQLSSGVGYTVSDNTLGFGINQRKILLYAGRPNETFAFQSIDLRLDKDFKISGKSLIELSAQVFNLFNHDNFTAYDGFEPALPNVNANFGQPNTEDPKRRFQFGLSFRF